VTLTGVSGEVNVVCERIEGQKYRCTYVPKQQGKWLRMLLLVSGVMLHAQCPDLSFLPFTLLCVDTRAHE